MSAHNGPLSRIFIFLLAPTKKLFECVRLEVFADIGINATVGDILDLIPRKATEPALVAQSLLQRIDCSSATEEGEESQRTRRRQRHNRRRKLQQHRQSTARREGRASTGTPRRRLQWLETLVRVPVIETAVAPLFQN